MSHTYSEFLPSYSVGVDCYKAIPEIVKPYGKKAVAVGGKTAMEKSKKALLEGIKGSDIEIIDFVWYGGDSSYENVEKIKNNPSVQKADMVFGIGGGRAVDTAKTYCALYNKPLFTFPTIASNCASCTSLSVMYNPDGTFKEYSYHKAPAIHTFINTKIIAESPEKLMWAGIGDALSKEYEVIFACREKNMIHTPLLGKAIASASTAKTMCRQRQLSRLRLTLLSRRDLFQILPSTKTIRIPRRIITTIHRSHIVFITVRHSFRNVNGSICTAKLFHSVCCVC